MKLLLSAIVCICASKANAQRYYNFDSLTHVICGSFKATSTTPDTLRITEAFEMHASFFNDMSEKEIEEVYTVLYLRLQMYCPDFDRISEIGYHNPEEGITISKDIPGKMKANECSGLFKTKKFYYLEGPSRVDLYLTDSTWKSVYADGTYSLLSLSKVKHCEFIITYNESNNFRTANVLKKGHQFRYKIIEELPAYFNLVSEDLITKKKQIFKLYK